MIPLLGKRSIRGQWDGHSSIAIRSTREIRDSDGLVFAKEVWAFCVKSFH